MCPARNSDRSHFYIVQECLTNERAGTNGGLEEDAGPGCQAFDFTADADVDLADYAYLQRAFVTP